MTTLWMDSCAGYASVADARLVYSGNGNTYSTTAGRWGTGALQCTSSTVFTKSIAAASGTISLGFCFAYSSLNTSTDFCYLTEAGANHVGICQDAQSRLTVRRNGTVLCTGSTQLFTGVYYMIQMKVTISDTAGSIELRVDDNQETLTFASGSNGSQDTRNGGTGIPDAINFFGTGSPQWSEIYVNDDVGSAPNNGLWGGYRIQQRIPSAAGNYAQWTPLSSTNVSNVDEQRHDSDTSYNSSSTANQKDSFQFSAISSTTGTIAAIRRKIVARKDDAGVRTIRMIQRQSGSDYNGASFNLTTAYAHYSEIFETNPATSSGYTVSEMGATSPEFGYEIVA